jgi:hypothetical protein
MVGGSQTMQACRWPGLSEPYAGALQEAVRFLLDRFDLAGIVASGSIIQGNPDPASDLDLYAIHREPRRQRIQRLFDGVRAELFVNPASAIRGYFREERQAGRPCTAHMLATGFVVLAQDPLVAVLLAEAREELAKRPDLSPLELTWKRYGAADGYENAMDIAVRDPANASLILHQAVREMVEYQFLAANRWLPRTKRLLADLAEWDGELGRLARSYYQESDPSTRFALAEAIAHRTIGATGFFEWESKLEDVTSA